jgi:hypothetical protein
MSSAARTGDVRLKVEQDAAAAFERDVAEHRMLVIRDEGVHRHLRFQRPDTGMYYFDLITWPGHLLINGDLSDSLVFSRIEDMFDFFVSDHGYRINPQYWAEKLRIPGRARAVQTYEEELYVAHVHEWIDETAEEMEGEEAATFREEATGELLDVEVRHFEEAAREALGRFRFGNLRISEPWEWSLSHWDFRFLVSCHAIVWGIEQYRATSATEGAEA